jgi:hypothetical protein
LEAAQQVLQSPIEENKKNGGGVQQQPKEALIYLIL